MIVLFYWVTDPSYERVNVDGENGEDEAQAWVLNVPLKQEDGKL